MNRTPTLLPALTLSQKTCLCLAGFTLAASMGAQLIWGQNLDAEMINNNSLATCSMPPSWKILKVAGACSAVAAGLLALVTAQKGSFGVLAVAAFLLVQVWMCGHSVQAYEDWSDWKDVFSDKGLMPMLATGLVFVGALKPFRRVFAPAAWALAGIAVLESLFALATASIGDRMEAMRAFIAPTQVLAVTSPWLIFSAPESGLPARVVSFVPAVMFLFDSLLSGTRTWSAVAIMFLVAVPFADVLLAVRRGEQPQWSKLLFQCGWVICAAVAIGGVFFAKVHSGIGSFGERLTKDTRSEQLIEFSESGRLSDLVLGTGPKGTWLWRGEEYPFVEGGGYLPWPSPEESHWSWPTSALFFCRGFGH